MNSSNYSSYFKEILKELRLTTFPTQNTVVNFTLFVVLFTVAMSIYLGVLDLAFGKGTLKFLEIFRGSDFITNFKADQISASTTDILNNIATTSATSTGTSTNILIK